MSPASKRSGWISVLEWTPGFAALAIAVLGALSIGPFVLPVALLLLWAANRRNRAWPESFVALLVGCGLIALWIAVRESPLRPMRVIGLHRPPRWRFSVMRWLESDSVAGRRLNHGACGAELLLLLANKPEQ